MTEMPIRVLLAVDLLVRVGWVAEPGLEVAGARFAEMLREACQ
ncbi:hypothetical protein [Amycolatopsis sp. NPDC049159]